MATDRLPIPPFFDPARVNTVWRVPYAERAADAIRWREAHDIRPASTDRCRILLLPVDMQNTFCLPDFELFVGGRSGHGAVDDVCRLCEFIYRNLGTITRINPTLDTHTAMQVFHPTFWINERGEHPEPYTLISERDVTDGTWRANPEVASSVTGGDRERLERIAHHYVAELSKEGRYRLTIWPYHAMLGGIGYALVSSLEEALFFHNIARSSQTSFEVKGNNPLTENYSVLRPEVLEGPDGEPIAHRNERFIRELLDYDMIIIAGEAKSHCMAWTIEDLLTEIRTRDPELVRKVYLLEDCTSPVVVPGAIDYTDEADDAFLRFEEAGMHVVRSTDPMERWPGVPL